MKKSFWVIFAFVLFVLALIVLIGIFLLSNKADTLNENQLEMAKIQHRTPPIVHSFF
jgi:flagellar basal body-associated protein FliL